MKRRKPLKRGKGLERRSELHQDAEKVREFLRRGRGQLKRTELRSKPRRRQKEGPLTAEQWRAAVFMASGGRCIITGAKARDVEDRRFHCHHVVPARVLRDRGLHGRVWDQRNGVLLRADVHELHESPGVSTERVPWRALPPCVWEFCAELDALDGTEWATSLIQRLHPASASADAEDVHG